MAINQYIKQINEQHSIKEAVISVFLANPIIKPERFNSLLKDQEVSKLFHKFEPLSNVSFKFEGHKKGLKGGLPQVQDNVGFILNGYSDGSLNFILRGLNEPQRSFISFHTLQYSRWNTFIEKFNSLFKIISEFQKGLFVTAFSLHYIDEFSWIYNSQIDVKKIFQENTKIIPTSFFESSNNLLVLNTQKQIDGFLYFDRIEIIADSSTNLVQVSHNITQQLDEPVELNVLLGNENEFHQTLDQAHKHNKTVLSEILQKDVCELINLKI